MAVIGFQLVVQHRAAGVLTSTNLNLDALVVLLGQLWHTICCVFFRETDTSFNPFPLPPLICA